MYGLKSINTKKVICDGESIDKSRISLSAKLPLVTIGIITFNRCNYLKRAINSALKQKCDIDFEVLVVNGGSTDNTESLLNSYSDHRLRVIIHKSNLGIPASRNSVVKNMKGEFLLWLDDDDALTEDALSSYLIFLSNNPSVDVAFGNVYFCDKLLNPLREEWYNEVDNDLLLYSLLFGNIIPNPGTLIRKNLFDKVGLYDSNLSRGEDYDFWVRCALVSAKFAHNDHFVCYYLQNEVEYFYDRIDLYIIKKNFMKAPLTKIFPMYDWINEPIKSKVFALTTIALVFYTYDDFDGALNIISKIMNLYPNKTINSLRMLCHLKKTKYYITNFMVEDDYLSSILTLDRENLRKKLIQGLRISKL